MAGENVVNYEGNKISLYSPEKGGQRDIAYIRPGDEIDLNFDIRDAAALKVEVINGDVHIVFANGSTLTLASMAAIGFAEDAPKIVTLDGKTLSLEEFLSVTEVLNYNEALLILANEKQVNTSEDEPKMIQVASDQDADQTAGTPITGQGDSSTLSKGVPSETIDSGEVEKVGVSHSVASFVSTIWTSNYPYSLDKTNYLPGDTTPKSLPNLNVTVLYGSQLANVGNTTVGGNPYLTYNYANGFDYTDDAFSQLTANNISQGSSTQDIFVNNSTDEMKYVFNMNYTKGIFPNYLEIVLPKEMADKGIKLSEFAGIKFSGVTVNSDGDTVYSVSEINPLGIMQFLMSFPINTQIANFDLTYNIKYLDPSSGEVLTANSTTSLSLYPVSEESNLDKSNGFVLSTVPNPVDVVTGSGDDIIVGGGANNTVRSNGGNDKIFVYGGNDYIDAGAGNDEVWGSQGDDILIGGDGNNSLYYDNRTQDIDPTGLSFKDYYYTTNTASAGIYTYYGFDVDALKGFAGKDFNNLSKIQNNDILIKKSQGIDLVRGFQDVYLSRYNDTLLISDKVNLGNFHIHGGDLSNPSGASSKDSDVVIIDDSFTGAVIKIGDDSTVNKTDGTVLSTFSDFETVRGSKNDDVFYGGLISLADGAEGDTVAITLDGGAGRDVISYENLASGYFIVFEANTGIVQKNDNSKAQTGADSIKNFEEIRASGGDDIFYATFSNNYVYAQLSATDKVSYEKSTSGVTIVFDGNLAEGLNVYKTSSYVSSSDLSNASGLYKDVLQGSLDLANNLSLSAKSDTIIVTDEAGSYNFNAGAGKDVLSYADLTNGIQVVFSGGTGTVTKSGGGIDTFTTTVNVNGNDVVNIYNIIATAGDDSFVMDDSDGNKTGFSLDGRGGNNTLSYDNISKDSAGDGTGFGVTFVFSSAGSSTVTRSASSITDYFKNFQNFVGSDFKDTVVFSSNTTIDNIQGLTFDLGAGEDTVNFTSVPSSQVDHIMVTFDANNNMVVTYKDSSDADIASPSTFINTEGVYGTAGNDVFTAVGGVNLFFDGSAGMDTADYSSISDDLVFNLFRRSAGNVQKGVDPNVNTDTLLNVEYIKGGLGNNTYYLDASVSYTIEGQTGATSNVVSYHQSSSPISYNVATNIVTKGSGASAKTDTLINVDTVKGSTWNDTFVIDYNMDNPVMDYSLYGNDVYGDGSGNLINPSNDTDKIDLTSFTPDLSITLDSSAAGSYNTYDPTTGIITAEGFVAISIPVSSGNVNLNLYHIEGIISGSGNDTFEIISSFEAAKGKAKWFIDGGAGTDTVSYENDANLSNQQSNGITGSVLQLDLSSLGATVGRFYNNSDDSAISRVEDTLQNIEKIILSQFDDSVNINTGWEQSAITDIDAGAGADTLNFSGITDEISVDFDTAGAFTSQILGSSGVLPTFVNFENIRLSSGKSTVHFVDGSNFANTVTISGSSNSTSEAILDFTAMSSAVTITLSQDRDGVDTIAGAMTANISFVSSFSNNGFTVLLADFQNIIYGSSQKSMNFTSVSDTATGNTLDYTNVTTFGVKINLLQEGGKVIKNNNDIIYDTFDNSFTTINGTTKADTVLITDLSVDFGSKNINLGGQQGDNVLIDVEGGASYDINNTTATDGTNSLNISGINDIDSVNFGKNNDTITFSADYESNNNPMNYAKYDGGEGDNSLDFSAMQNIIFDANTQKISKNAPSTAYSSITWAQGKDYSGANADLIFQRFYTIIAAASESIFYGQARNSYNFVGGAGNDTINYSQATSNIYVYLLDLQIYKNNNAETIDTFNDKIDTIIGSTQNDTVIINKIQDVTWNLTVDGAEGTNTVNFAFDATSGTSVNVTFDSTGSANFDLIKGGNTTSVSVSLKNFQSYLFTENDDTIVVDSSLGSGSRFNGSAGNDTINYTGAESIVYDSTKGTVTRGTVVDNINQIEVISYEGGTGTATFLGSQTANRTYLGDSSRTTFDPTNYSDAVIDYSSQSPTTSISVDFTLTNGLMKITKSGTDNYDYFNSYITKIIGTKGNDTFVLAERDASLPNIRLEGGGGNDKVSYANYATGANFEVDANGQVTITGGSPFSGYVIDSSTVKGFELTKGNDTFTGALETQLDIDGSDGVDLLDYSAVSTSSNQVNITIDFSGDIGTVQKFDVANNKFYTDIFENFEGAKTGSGDDTIIIGDRVITSTGSTGNIDVGEGMNALDASKITYNMSVVFGGDTAADAFKSTITYSGGSLSNPATADYNGFQQITLGSGSNDFTYYHDAAYESLNLKFATTHANLGDSFILAGSANKTFFVDGLDINSFFFSTTDGGASFLETDGFSNIIAKDTNYTLSIKAAGLSNDHTFWGGNTGGDEIDYTSAVTGLTAKILEDADGVKYIEIKGSDTNAFIDNLYNIENITLSDENDIFEIDDISGYTDSANPVIIDAAGGLSNELSLANLTVGVNAEIDDNGGLILDIGGNANIQTVNFQTTSLTNQDDTVKFREETATIVKGNDGNDTADYATNTFTNGVTLSVVENIAGDAVINVNKKASGKDDQLQSFESFVLTANDDELVYSGNLSLGNDTIVIDMGEGSDTVDFSSMDSSITGTEFLYDENGVLNINSASASTTAIHYQIKNMDTVILGGTNSSLVIKSLPNGSLPVTFDGGSATNVSILDLSQLTNGDNLTVDVYKESVFNDDNSLGLFYVNFRGIVGSTKVSTYNMSEINQNNEAISYTITTNNASAKISYENGKMLGELSVEVDGANATVVKSNGEQDTISGGFGEIDGSEYDDTFTFKSTWEEGLVIDGGQGTNTLTLQDVDVGIKYTIDLSKATSEDSAISNGLGKRAVFKNFANITGTQANDEFILSLAGIARDYTGVTLSGGLSDSANTFTTTGTGLGAAGTVSIDSSIFFSSVINNFSVGVSLSNFDTLNFSADMNMNVSFADYKTSSIVEISGFGGSNDTLDVSSTSSKIIIKNDGSSGGDVGFSLEKDSGTMIVKGFENLILGSQKDEITFDNYLPNLNIDGGGSTETDPDTLEVKFYTSVFFTKDMAQVYNVLGSDYYTGVHSDFTNFPNITLASESAVYLLDDARLSYLVSLNGTSNSKLFLDAYTITTDETTGSTTVTETSAISEAKLDLDNGNLQINAASFSISGFSEYHFGEANDEVIASGQQAIIYGEGGNNTLTETSTTGGTITFTEGGSGSVLVDGSLTLHDFYTVNFSTNDVTNNKAVMEAVADGKSYVFNNVTSVVLTGTASIQAAGLNNLVVGSGVTELTSSSNDISIRALRSDFTPSIDLSAVSINTDFNAEVGSVGTTPSETSRTLIAAPVVDANHHSVVNLTDFTGPDGTLNQGHIYFNIKSYADGGQVGINDGLNASIDLKNFDIYELGSYKSEVSYFSDPLVDGWQFYGGGNNLDEVNNSENNSNLSILAGTGNVIVDSSNNAQHIFQGFEVFTGFNSVKLDMSQAQYEQDISNYLSQHNDISKSSISSVTQYNMTNGNDTLMVSEVKNNNIVDIKQGDDSIVLNGDAAFYSVEHFKDQYITIDGKQYNTGGNYLIVTDDDGNQMYIFNATLDDIKAGGKFNSDDQSSNYKYSQDNYDSSKPVENDNNHHSTHNNSSNSHYSDGSNGVSSFSVGLGDGFNNNDFNHNLDSSSSLQGHNNLPFELVEDGNLNLHYDDEFNVNVENNHEANQNNQFDTNHDVPNINNIDVAFVDNLMVQGDFTHNQDATQNHNVSENDLHNLLNQTFTNEADSVDNLNIDVNSSNNIDISSINENLVEETQLQETDIESYKLESERNEDGTLKINHHNNSNNNGGLGSL